MRIRTKLNDDISLTLYLTLIQAYLEYFNIISASVVHLPQLFIKQKKAIVGLHELNGMNILSRYLPN